VHAPPWQRYGEQSFTSPVLVSSVTPSERQVPVAGTHVPVAPLQVKPWAQWLAAVQVVRQAFWSQA
jgi:hypothetical protein